MDGLEGAERLKFPKLELCPAGIKQRRQHEQFIRMANFPYRDVERSRHIQDCITDYCIAVRVQVDDLGGVSDEYTTQWRVVGTLWGEVLRWRSNVFSITLVAADSAFRGVAYDWLMKTLRKDMEKNAWPSLEITTPAHVSGSSLERFAKLHLFQVKQRRKRELLWEWTPDLAREHSSLVENS